MTHPTRRTPTTLREVWEGDLAVAPGPGEDHTDPRPHRHGWLLDAGVPEVLAPLVGAPSRESGDFLRYARLDAVAAGALLDRLPASALTDRQNDAPSLGRILRATVAHPRDLLVHGYLVGPRRCDERLTAEGVFVRYPGDLTITRKHADGCDCQRLVEHVADLGVDDAVQRTPHELGRADWLGPALGRNGEQWWRLWWD